MLVMWSCDFSFPGKTGVTANRDKIEFRLFNSSLIFKITLREELFSKELDSGDYHHETRTRRHVWFFFGKENNSSRRVILKIELELNNLNSILSRSAVTPVFPFPLTFDTIPTVPSTNLNSNLLHNVR